VTRLTTSWLASPSSASTPDVPEGVRILRQHGLRPVTLTNGSASVADRLPCPGYLAAPNLRAPGLVALAGQIVT